MNAYTQARVCLFILALGCAGSFGAANEKPAAEYPAMSSVVWWEPYAYDTAALFLSHCDERNPVQEDVDLNAPAAHEAPNPFEEPGAAGKTESPGLRNACPMGARGALIGDCRLVPGGRFNGGLQFGGGSGKLVVAKPNAAPLKTRTIEFWIKLDELPRESATLAAFSGTRLNPVSLQVLPDGTLRLVWNKQKLPFILFQCPVNEWFHLALEWGICPPGDAIKAVVFANGREIGSHVFPEYVPGYTCPELGLADVTVGNDPEGNSGIHGMVDEVRLSSTFRRFYPYGLAGLPREPSDGPRGPPYFRDSADLLFHAAFNRTLKPAVCAPKTTWADSSVSKADEEVNPSLVRRHFQPGVEGQALVIGKDGLDADYAGPENLQTDAGTIAFRMRPLDWDNYTRHNSEDHIEPSAVTLFHILGEFPEAQRPPNWTPTVPIARLVVPQNLPAAVANPVDFSPGLWTHIAVVWETNQVSYYVNGKAWQPDDSFAFRICDLPQFKPALEQYWPRARPVRLCFWDPDRKVRRQEPHTLLDDFRVYRRPLAPTEIANLAVLYTAHPQIQSLPPMDVRMDYNGVLGRVDLALFPLMTNYAQAATASARVTKEGAAAAAGTATAAIAGGRQVSLCVTTPPMEFASYRVEVDVRDLRGETMGSATQNFARVKPPWYGCRAGVSDKVMPEWTPVKADGNVVSIWGREIHFTAAGLPEKIMSAGQDILAGPVELTVTAQGLPVALASPEPGARITARKETRADVRGECRGPDFRLTTEAYVEFDGLTWFTLTLSPEAGRQPDLDGLTIRIPYKAQNAELVQWWSGHPWFRDQRHAWTGATPSGEGRVFSSADTNTVRLPAEMRGSFLPYVCLTGNERGMAWFAENDRGWTQSAGMPAVSIERHNDTVTLVLHVLSSAVRLEAPRTFSFGLHPVPVKPLDPDWRMTPGWGVIPNFNCDQTIGPPFTIFNFGILPGALDWKAAHQRFVEGGKSQINARYEQNLRQFRQAHGREPRPREIAMPALYWDMQYMCFLPHEVCREWLPVWNAYGCYVHYTPEFLDFCSWAWDEWLAHGDIKGVYMDDCWAAPMTTLGSGVAYSLPDGHIQPGYQFRAYRERFKRIRQVFYDRGLVPHMCVHMTHKMLIPYMSFFDVYLDGEDFYSRPPAQDDFIDHWPLDRMRYNNNRKWGLIPMWCEWTGGNVNRKKYPAWSCRQQRAYEANMWLHDIVPRGTWSCPSDVEFLQPDTVTLPYWEPSHLATHEHRDLKITAWKRPGKCMVLLVNIGTNRLEAKVSLDLRAMGFVAGNPEEVRITDADPGLLTRFADDPTTINPPAAPRFDTEKDIAADDAADFRIEERLENLPSGQRRAQDPDAKFVWKDGILQCRIRRHDYRRFVFNLTTAVSQPETSGLPAPVRGPAQRPAESHP